MFYYAGKNGNGDMYSWYIPITLKFSGCQPSQFSKNSNEQIINYRYTIITLKLTKLYSTAFAAQFDASLCQ